MNEWIIKLIATSIFLTVCTYLLPNQNIKRTAAVVFGFVFITVLIEPIQILGQKDLLYEAKMFFSQKIFSSDNQSTDVENTIFEEYREKIQYAVEEYINDNSNVYCSHCKVYVNQDMDSPDFGCIETIYCYVSPESPDEDRVIHENKNEIQQIVIDINGIRFETEENIAEQDKEYLKELQKLVANYLNITIETVHIMETEEE